MYLVMLKNNLLSNLKEHIADTHHLNINNKSTTKFS
ncbi:MAG: hypothetical protein GAK29_04226 [Acinetobacter bereziniae]|uniref:Uncharacterized protein n=1 Tax=Acinetobacter bereziniae TaxID=106648 RepID=A0A833PAH2_ACIBZ|nr:MAG: hypothetical protein GAK29_04226 [Acinetobacter bereziniae]